MTEHGSIARTRPRDGRRPVGAASSWATPVWSLPVSWCGGAWWGR